MQPRSCQERESAPGSRLVFRAPSPHRRGTRRRQRRTRSMVHGKNRIPYWIDRRLTGLAGPDYDATISFGLPFESEDSQYGKYRVYTTCMREHYLCAVLSPLGRRAPSHVTLLGRLTLPELIHDCQREKEYEVHHAQEACKPYSPKSNQDMLTPYLLQHSADSVHLFLSGLPCLIQCSNGHDVEGVW